MKTTHSCVLAVCLLDAVSASAAEQHAAVAGVVADARTGRPVPYARVEALHTPTAVVADEAGRFQLDGLTAGQYVLRAIARGYAVLTQTVDTTSGTVGSVKMLLEPTPLRTYEDVVVTARRDEVASFDAARSTTTVSADWLAERLPRTTPEALMESTGVWVQKTNHGGGSPFIRGLVGNQILVVVDGIRLNNSTFRLGPNQYLATIDPAQAASIEVVRGSGSVLYGSDALGGVVQVVSRRPQFSSDGAAWMGTLIPKYTGQGMERGGRLDLEGRSARAAIVGGISVRRFGDLVAGGSLGIEAPSGYDEIAGDAKALFRVSRSSLLTLAYQHLHQNDVPRFDQVAQRGFARYAFDPQIRRLSYAKLQTFAHSPWMRSITTTASLHQSSERRVRQQQVSSVRITEQDDVGTIGLTAEAKAIPSSLLSFVYGVEYYRDRIGSTRRDVDTASGSAVERRGLYPDAATAASAAVFTHGTVDLGRFTVELGARYTQYKVTADDPRFGRTAIARGSLVANVGSVYALTPGVNLFASVAQGFRAPNLDDLSTLGSFDFGVEVPSPALSPERALSYEIGTKARGGLASGSVALFRIDLTDLIDRVRSTFEGSSLYEGQQVYRRANVGGAYIHGFETDFEWLTIPSVALFGNLAYAYGQQTTTDQPVRRIPPLHGALGLRWQATGRLGIQGVLRSAGKQDRLAPGDLEDHRIARGGTPAWQVVDVHGRYAASARLEIVGGLQNVFNEPYRIHGSGIDGPGRSFWSGAKVRFGLP